MTILIDLTSLADNISGIERYAACIAKGMIEQSDDKFILIFKGNIHPIFQEIANRENVKAEVLAPCNKLLFNQIRLPWAIRKHKANWYLFLAFPVPVLLFKRNMVSTIHDICCWDCPETMKLYSKVYFRISHRVVLKKCIAIMTISEFSKQRIIEKLKYDANKIWVIYCGIDQYFKPTTDEQKIKSVFDKYNLPEKYILSLSTLEPRKNLRLLVEAYRDLVLTGNINTPLVLAGRRGWKIDGLLASIEMEVSEMIKFTGFIDDADLPAIYGNSLYFVFPSLYEGFGLPPLEALACGARVLSSDAASLPEVLGREAVYYKSGDKEDLKNKLLNYHYYKPQHIQYSIREQVDKFSWNRESKKLLAKISTIGV